jgi:GNAT superfamily N-acetyltransferase
VSLRIRPATIDELRLVASSWFESYRRGGYAPEVPYPTYQIGQGQAIDRCIESGRVIVAVNPIEPDEVCGWLCFTHGITFYVYVKQAYRRRGIARALHEAAGQPTLHTCETRAGRKLAAAVHSSFNPYILAAT